MVKDSYGNSLVIGDIVAYNLGGVVTVGVIENITWFTRYGEKYSRVHVATHNVDGPSGWTSKVENENSLLLLPCFPWDNIHIIGSTDQEEGGEPHGSKTH